VVGRHLSRASCSTLLSIDHRERVLGLGARTRRFMADEFVADEGLAFGSGFIALVGGLGALVFDLEEFGWAWEVELDSEVVEVGLPGDRGRDRSL